MKDDGNDVLDISFDDDAEEPPAADNGVLQIDLEPAASPSPAAPVTPPSPGPSAPQKAVSPDDTPSGDLPMLSSGVCPRCGYALRPLETQCPRCARLGPRAPSAIAPEMPSQAAEAPQEEFPAARPRRGCLLGGLIGSVLLLALAAAIPIAIYMQPAQRAKREYRLGLQAQLHASFDEARLHCQKALELDPDMGLAAFSMGTTYLGIGDPALMQSIQDLVKRAEKGETRELDLADEWFRKTIEIGRRLPPGKQLMDQRIRTPARLRAFAHASLALTAYIRAAAAMQADALENAMAWLQVAQSEAQAAIVDDPTNTSAEQILRTVGPMVPPSSTPN